MAAAVAVLVVGVTFAFRAGHASEAAGPFVVRTSAATSPAADPCDGGWTSFGTTVITAGTNPVDIGTTAILRFAGGTPGAATLCAVIAGPDHQTVASGSAAFSGSKLGYLARISGGRSYFVGAFGSGVASLTFAPGQAPASRGESGPVKVTATTAGVIALDDGWHGYAMLAPRTASSVLDVTATAPDGTVVGSEHLSLADETTRSPSSAGRTAAPRATSPGSSAVGTTAGSTAASSMSAMQCGGQLPAPLPGISATPIPQPNGGWRFRLTNGTRQPLTMDTLHGYAQLMANDHGVVQSVSSDQSLVLRTPITLMAADSIDFGTVGLDTFLCTGKRVPPGDHTVHLVLSGEMSGRDVVFTAASFVVHFPTSGPPILVG